MKWKHKVIVFIAILCASCVIHRGHLFSFPSAIHSWSQTDHIALAHGFIKNGFNFFLPQTYMFNKVYETYSNTITAVDFPLNNYIVAVIMKATGDNSAAPFRFYMLIYSCTGLVFFFLFVHRKSKSWLLSAVLVLFVFGSAVFLDYQDGMIPSISALSNVFIAVYFLDLYWNSQRKRWFAIALFFLSLAALVRTPYALFIIALVMEWLVQSIRKKRPVPIFEIVAMLSSMAIPILYFVYNGHMRSQYGTIFLSKALPPKSFDEVFGILNTIHEKWLLHYWSVGNYIALALVFFLTVFMIVRPSKFALVQLLDSRLTVWLIIALGGGMAYMLLMLYQFSQHDYYILDSLFGTVLLVFSVSAIVLYRAFGHKKILMVALLTLSIYGFRDSIKVLEERRKHDVRSIESRAYESYLKANGLLERLGVKVDDKILVADSYAPNLPLIAMDRVGYSVPYPTESTIDIIQKWDWKYILLQDYLLERLFLKPYPKFFDNLKRIGGNGEISIFERLGGAKDSDLISLMNITAKQPFFVDTTYYRNWDRFNSAPKQPQVGLTKPEMEYDLSKTFILNESPAQRGIHLVAEMDYSLIFPDNEIFLTVVVEQADGKLLDWQAIDLKDVPTDEVGNRKLKQFFAIHNLKDHCKLMVSIWNPGKNEMQYKNIKVSFYDGED